MTLEELITVYRVQFPVMQQYERETFYDQKGRIVFTVSKGLVGVGLNRTPKKNETPCVIEYPDGRQEIKTVGWEDIRYYSYNTSVTQFVMDNTLPSGPRNRKITYHAPFFSPNREQDYCNVWRAFLKRRQEISLDN